jgi:cyclic pyranopterin phosphate synthase
MVNVASKRATARFARAEAWVEVTGEVASMLRRSGNVAKGNVLETARIAGILASKRAAELIPMCHPLAIDSVEIDAEIVSGRVRVESRVRCEGKTGVEMEAMVAVAVAALTVYDMIKSLGRGTSVGPIRLLEKSGGKSGRWSRSEVERGKG